MPVKFSVIIPTYNRAELLRVALASVFAQTFTDLEVIVVDDGSTDDTAQVVAGYGNKVRLWSQPNRGPGAARNLGAQWATGEYLAFLDSDDCWFPWSLEIYAALIVQYDSPAFLAGKPFHFERQEQLAGVVGGAARGARFADYYASSDAWRWWGVSSFVMQAQAFRAAGGFAEANINGEDGDLALKLGTAAGFVQVSAPFTFGYREHGGNVTADLGKTLAGIWHKIKAEQAGAYPGGAGRAKARRQIITREARPVMLACLQRGMRPEAQALYRATFAWHLRLGRWKFLAGFPLKTLCS